MRIKILVSELDIRGGTHKQVVRLACFLSQQGHDVEILTNRYDAEATYREAQQLPVRVLTHSSIPPRSRIHTIWTKWATIVKTSVELARFDGIINIHDNGFQSTICLTRLLSPSSYIVWQVNDLPGFFSEGIHGSLKSRPLDFLRRMVSRLAARSSNRLTVNVSKNRERVRRHYGVDAEVIHCGVDFPSTTAPDVGKHDVSKKNIRLLSIGVLFEYRNYESIIRAQKYLADEKGIETSCSVIGQTNRSKEYHDQLLRLSADLGIRFDLLGQVNDEQLKNEFEHSDIFLFVNIDQSWGLAIFEAMARGIPCVVSNSVGAVEVLRDGEGVKIVDPTNIKEIADAIVFLLDDQRRSAQQEAARQYVKNMSWDSSYCRRVEQIFENRLG